MKKLIALVCFVFVAACTSERASDSEMEGSAAQAEFSVSDSGVKTKHVEGFGGVIAESYEDSQEWWPPEERPQEGSPNVIIFLLDDVGFAQVESFGGIRPGRKLRWTDQYTKHRQTCRKRFALQQLSHHRPVFAIARVADGRTQPAFDRTRQSRINGNGIPGL
jgi:hypothetical protein